MDWDKQTIDEWNELGFYYEYDDGFRQWRFFGSKAGLHRLPELINAFGCNPANEGISEHKHLGPYNYLKIMSWHEPIITDKHVAGSLKDLLTLSKLLDNKINAANVGQVLKISSEYSTKSSATLLFIIMSDGFIPSSIEF